MVFDFNKLISISTLWTLLCQLLQSQFVAEYVCLFFFLPSLPAMEHITWGRIDFSTMHFFFLEISSGMIRDLFIFLELWDLCYRWSLLEKYSCKASKLHLKPRRFKIFIEALVSQHCLSSIVEWFPVNDIDNFSASDWLIIFLMKEHQLLKDRRKNVRKRPSQGENSPLAAPSTVSNQSRASGQDARTVKLVLVDSQNIQRLGSGKTSVKRNINVGVNRCSNKGESTTMKPPRQRRKPGDYPCP